jgi:hypothetical protein
MIREPNAGKTLPAAAIGHLRTSPVQSAFYALR